MMLITKQTVADKIAAYLRHDITLGQLVDWAENGLMEGEFEEREMDALRTVIARLGVADVCPRRLLLLEEPRSVPPAAVALSLDGGVRTRPGERGDRRTRCQCAENRPSNPYPNGLESR